MVLGEVAEVEREVGEWNEREGEPTSPGHAVQY